MLKNVFITVKPRVLLSTLWVFAILNYIYADILGFYEEGFLAELVETGAIQGIEFSNSFLLMASILMETAIIMVLLSRVLKHRLARWTNVVAGILHTFAVGGSMFVGSAPTASYIFFGTIEMLTTLFIAWYAWNWKENA